MWPKITLLLPVWPRDTKRLDTPATLLNNTFLKKEKSYFSEYLCGKYLVSAKHSRIRIVSISGIVLIQIIR